MPFECRRYVAAFALVSLMTGGLIAVHPHGSFVSATAIILSSILLLFAIVWLEFRLIATGGSA